MKIIHVSEKSEKLSASELSSYYTKTVIRWLKNENRGSGHRIRNMLRTVFPACTEEWEESGFKKNERDSEKTEIISKRQ